MDGKLNIGDDRTITNDGKIISKQGLEIIFLGKTSFDADLVLTVFANMYIDQFAKRHIEDYHSASQGSIIHYKLFRIAYETLLEQMIVFANLRGTKEGQDGKEDLLAAASAYPKS